MVIKALTFEIGRLDRPSCNDLIAAIIKIKWYQNGSDFMAAYARFLAVLVSGIPKWYTSIVVKLISEFVQVHYASVHHSALDQIVGLMPTCKGALPDILRANFPHKTESSTHTLRYIKNALWMTEYVPEVRGSVWGLVMEKIVDLDAELQDELGGLNDLDVDDPDMSSDEEGDQAVDALETDITNMDNRSESDTDEEDLELNDAGNNAASALVVRRKLDKILFYLLNYLDSKLTNYQHDPDTSGSLFALLQNLFKTYVLSTYQTRCVQYLLFYAAHADSVFMDAFLAFLIETALSPTEAMETRLRAVQYVASFIARARGISTEQLLFVVRILSAWLTRYVQERELEVGDGSLGLGMGRFRLFYAVAQALMYLFCFRHHILKKQQGTGTGTGLADDDEDPESSVDSDWHCNLDKLFRRLIITKFNPLGYCQRTVVAMFAQIAQKEDLVYCYTIMEQNRLGLNRDFTTPALCSSSSSNNNNSTHNNNNSPAKSLPPKRNSSSTTFTTPNTPLIMDTFFPFDPLNLPATRQKVSFKYVEWSDVADEDEDSGSELYSDDNEDEDEVEDEDDEDDELDNEV